MLEQIDMALHWNLEDFVTDESGVQTGLILGMVVTAAATLFRGQAAGVFFGIPHAQSAEILVVHILKSASRRSTILAM
jgi:hypothetical protein